MSNSTESGSSTESGVAAETASTVVKDYEFARNELAQAQDARSVTNESCVRTTLI